MKKIPLLHQYNFYALSAIIAVGYKVNSQRAIRKRLSHTKKRPHEQYGRLLAVYCI